MAGANSNVQMTDLDFNNIKTNLKTFLQSQDVLKDYNYEGAALSTLLDVLAYNTQYNAYYLNMVANEMFLDSAIQRASVVSHAKLLGYTPKSAIAPTAEINLKMNEVTTSSLTIPKFTTFLSEAIDGVNYTFVTTDSYTVNTSANTAFFQEIYLKQGIPSNLNYTVDIGANPTLFFEIPETNIDTTSLEVIVQESGSNNYSEVYNLATNYLSLNSSSRVYFLQETSKGTYEIYFGDGIIGKQLKDGNIVRMTYLLTQGSSSAGANNFVLMEPISGFSNNIIYPITSASQGSTKESINSIKFQAPKAYSAQGRAVTKEDYITAIQQSSLGFNFDSVNVWGGEENIPPVYGKVFISLKPTGGYTLTQTQKNEIIYDVIKPISVVTVDPTIIDPDYTYLKFVSNVLYDPKKTTLTSTELNLSIKNTIINFCRTNLNTFNATFSLPDLITAIKNSNPSIITNECSVSLQKKIKPNLSNSTSYSLYYGVPLKQETFLSGISSSPSLYFTDPTNINNLISNVYLEEVPYQGGQIASISVINPGFGYVKVPTVTIYGDGTGAKAQATLNPNGSIRSIEVTNTGRNYTSALVLITPQSDDKTGQLGLAIANLTTEGTIRSYYYLNNVKTILDSNVGTIDYINGVITLNDFNPKQIDNIFGELTITANPSTFIVNSSFNKIITLDEFDSNAIQVNITAKSS